MASGRDVSLGDMWQTQDHGQSEEVENDHCIAEEIEQEHNMKKME